MKHLNLQDTPHFISQIFTACIFSIVIAVALTACGSDNDDGSSFSDKSDKDESPLATVNTAPNVEIITKSIDDSDIVANLVVATFKISDKNGDKLTKSLGDNAQYFKIDNHNILLTQAGVDYLTDNTDIKHLAVQLNASDGQFSSQASDYIDITRTLVEPAGMTTAFFDNFESGNLNNWSVIDLSGSNNWGTGAYAAKTYAIANCYKSKGDCNDWMISKPIDLSDFTTANLTFTTAQKYGKNPLKQFNVLMTKNFNGDPTKTVWTNVTDKAMLSEGNFKFTDSGEIALTDFIGQPIYLAFHYKTAIADASSWEVTNIKIQGKSSSNKPLTATINIRDEQVYNNRGVLFSANATNGSGSGYKYQWDFGDGMTGAGKEVTHTYKKTGDYVIKLTVTDGQNNQVDQSSTIKVMAQTKFMIPKKDGLRVATFNAALDKIRKEGKESNTTKVGELKTELDNKDYIQAKKLAEIVQRINADILILNEIDGNDNQATVDSFYNNYLKIAQNGSQSINYPYIYSSLCNTGVLSGEDYDGNGSTTDPNDAYGYGHFPGKYCMAIFSKHPIDTSNARTFQKFLWKDMPNNLQPMNEDGSSYYSTKAWQSFRLSSKTHIDLPVQVDGKTVHLLASHPTPPVFDGKEDRNGKRNFDEIRLWADYINPNSNYLYDDAGNKSVSLKKNTRFIIFGDQNASSVEGDATVVNGTTAINQLLEHSLVSNLFAESNSNNKIPMSDGGIENAKDNDFGKYHTTAWKMRADYILPSDYGLKVNQSGVFWPKQSDDLYYLIHPVDTNDFESSDHRLVWMDLTVE